MMRSEKPVKALDDIVLKYPFCPPVSVFIGVNGTNLICDPNKTIDLNIWEFEAILYSQYSKYL